MQQTQLSFRRQLLSKIRIFRASPAVTRPRQLLISCYPATGSLRRALFVNSFYVCSSLQAAEELPESWGSGGAPIPKKRVGNQDAQRDLQAAQCRDQKVTCLMPHSSASTGTLCSNLLGEKAVLQHHAYRQLRSRLKYKLLYDYNFSRDSRKDKSSNKVSL